MSCFFPPIFKKNTYKKVRFFILSALVLGAILLFSGCRIVKGVVSAPFKAVGWGATKVSEVIEGKEPSKLAENAPEGHPWASTDPSGPVMVDEINFVPLILWGIILVALALIVRFLMNRHVEKSTK